MKLTIICLSRFLEGIIENQQSKHYLSEEEQMKYSTRTVNIIYVREEKMKYSKTTVDIIYVPEGGQINDMYWTNE